jgi:hypothetical protein
MEDVTELELESSDAVLFFEANGSFASREEKPPETRFLGSSSEAALGAREITVLLSKQLFYQITIIAAASSQ